MYENKTVQNIYLVVADAILSSGRNSARATEVVSRLAKAFNTTNMKASANTIARLVFRKEVSVRTYANGRKYLSLTKKGCNVIREINKQLHDEKEESIMQDLDYGQQVGFCYDCQSFDCDCSVIALAEGKQECLTCGVDITDIYLVELKNRQVYLQYCSTTCKYKDIPLSYIDEQPITM